MIDRITKWTASTKFIIFHILWFSVWIALGSTLHFDKFPFGLLTLIVSLEAILLSSILLITQANQDKKADERDQLDLDTDLGNKVLLLKIAREIGCDGVEDE